MSRAALLLPLVLLLAKPAAVPAQHRQLAPYAGVSMGANDLPDILQGCSPETSVAAEVRAGLARGGLALEGRLAAMGPIGMEGCAIYDLGDPFVPVNGIHTSVDYPFRGSDGHLAADLRLRAAAPGPLPVTLSAGAGWLSPVGVPYLLAAAGVRSGGRFRLVLDVERDWYRVRSTEHTIEWKDRVPVREVSRVERREWLAGTGVRAGVEVPFR